LPKFKEVIDKVENFFTRNNEIDLQNYNVFITGDFNFPQRIVTWYRNQDVMVPDLKSGESKDKNCFLTFN